MNKKLYSAYVIVHGASEPFEFIDDGVNNPGSVIANGVGGDIRITMPAEGIVMGTFIPFHAIEAVWLASEDETVEYRDDICVESGCNPVTVEVSQSSISLSSPSGEFSTNIEFTVDSGSVADLVASGNLTVHSSDSTATITIVPGDDPLTSGLIEYYTEWEGTATLTISSCGEPAATVTITTLTSMS